MPFLTLNGITIPGAYGSLKATPEIIGSAFARGISGQGGSAIRKKGRTWALGTSPMSMAESKALQNLIEGQGAHWPLDSDTKSDSGILLASGTQGTFNTGSLSGQGSYHLCSGYSGGRSKVEWYVGPAAEWSIVCTVYQGGHFRWVKRSDGKLWRSGVLETQRSLDAVDYTPETGRIYQRAWIEGGASWEANQNRALGSMVLDSGGTRAWRCTKAGITGASAPAWPASPVLLSTINDGSVIWQYVADSGGASHLGDLLWFPFLVPDSWIPQLATFLNTNPGSPLPYLSAAGDFYGGSVTVEGEVTAVKDVQYWNASEVWTTGETVEFVLREVL